MRPILPEKLYGDEQSIALLLQTEQDVRLVKRLNAIRLLLNGYTHKQVADISNVCRETIWDWVAKWNQGGKEGLISKHKGSVSKVTPAIMAEISEVIEIKREINGRTVTGKLIHGYLKKTTT
jgi:transposase